MDNLNLGLIITTDQQRDAVHIAVAPVTAGAKLFPGERIGIVDGELVDAMPADLAIGIVDTFLKDPVAKGQRFWMFLFPGSITSLRHEWSHPSLPNLQQVIAGECGYAGQSNAKAESEAWLRHFCENSDCPGYEIVIAAAIGDHDKNTDPLDPGYIYSSNDGQYLHFNGRDAHGEIPEEFWHHVEVVTGKKIPYIDKAKYFSCSC